MYYVYVLRSLKDNSLYKGFSNNLKNRLGQHNSGKSTHTSGRTPWILVYFEEFQERDLAIKREKYLKSAAGRKFLKNVDLESEKCIPV